MNCKQKQMEKLEELHLGVIDGCTTFYTDVPDDINTTKAVFELASITKQVAIDFSLWQQRGECIWISTDEDEWVHPYTDESMTTEELFDEFLKTYEL